MIITHKITMDLVKSGAMPRVEAVQNDRYSRNLAISLLADGKTWQIPTAAKATVSYRKSDGTGGCYDALEDGTKAWSISGNVLTVALASQVCTVPGCVELMVSLQKGENVLSTFTVCIVVQRNPGLQPISGDYYKVMGSLAESGWLPDCYLGTDEAGNVVEREAPDGVSLEQVEQVVAEYMAANPTDPGVNREEVEEAIEEYMQEHPVEAGATPEQAAQIEKNTRDIAALPLSVSDDGYTDITGLRRPTGISVVRDYDTITVTAQLQGEESRKHVITLDENDYPTKVVSDLVECAISWEGFADPAVAVWEGGSY